MAPFLHQTCIQSASEFFTQSPIFRKNHERIQQGECQEQYLLNFLRWLKYGCIILIKGNKTMAILRILSTVFALVLASPAISAAPTFVYGFTISSFSCDNHPFISCPEGASSVPNWSVPLAQMTIGLSIDAVLDQQASLSINGLGTFGNITNQGIESFNPTRWNAGDGELNLNESALTGFPRSFVLNSFFNVSRYLTGQLYINDTSDEVFMSTSGSNLWSGFIRSDQLGLSTSILNFTGEWKFIRAVPEPSTLALLICAALVMAAITRKRRGLTLLSRLE